MKKYYGNYLGICISNSDPQHRGRVQIFIPNIMPALYGGWNANGKDITISGVGDNLQGGIPSEVIENLKKILPWAEAASPIMGSSSPGTTGIISKIASGIKSFFDQSPTATPSTGSSDPSLFQKAAKYGKVTPEMFQRTSSNSGLCATGVRQMLGALTNDSYFGQGLSSGSGGSQNAGSLTIGGGNNYLTKSGYFNAPVSVPDGYTPQKGDVIAGSNSGAGHVQVFDGVNWISDFTQTNGILTNYQNQTLYTMNDKGLSAVGTNAESALAAGATNSVSGTVASASPHQSTVPLSTDPSDPSYGNAANPAVAPVNAPNTGNNTISPGLAAGFAVIGQGETGFQSGEANTDRYNQVNNNSNVRAGVNKGMSVQQAMASYGDYGFYQCNDANEGVAVEKYCLSQGFSQDQATYYRQAITNNAGKGSFSVSDQTQAMSYLFAKEHPSAVQQLNALNSDDPNFKQSVNQIMLQFKGQWFGIPRGIQENAADPNSQANQIIKNGKAISSPNVVNNPDRHGPTATLDVNNAPKGMFSYPSPGALLWVFFQEGNPLFPVYFAANYGAAEWQSAYKTSSPGQGMSPTPNAEGATSQGGVWTTESGGGIHWVNDDHPTDPTQTNKSLMIFSHDGSNMHFNTGYHQIYSKFDRRDQVEKDRFESTGGNHETLVQGDHNHVVMGDMIVKVGNVSQPAVDAVTRIQQLLNEIHAPLTKSS